VYVIVCKLWYLDRNSFRRVSRIPHSSVPLSPVYLFPSVVSFLPSPPLSSFSALEHWFHSGKKERQAESCWRFMSLVKCVIHRLCVRYLLQQGLLIEFSICIVKHCRGTEDSDTWDCFSLTRNKNIDYRNSINSTHKWAVCLQGSLTSLYESVSKYSSVSGTLPSKEYLGLYRKTLGWLWNA